MKRSTILLLLFISFVVAYSQNDIKVGAESTDEYYSIIQGKRIAIMSNHTGMVGNEHLVDILAKEKFNIVCNGLTKKEQRLIFDFMQKNQLSWE